MLTFPQFDPVLVQVGPLAIRWYGLMYTISFLLGWPLLKLRGRRHMPEVSVEVLGDLLIWILAGVVLGGRLGYVFFYQTSLVFHDPLMVLRVWEGGMSFHGGLAGVLLASGIYCRRQGLSLLAMADLVIPIVPLGLFLGRIGNFINGELWGRATDLPWAMVFPGAGPLPRHPSQLYESLLEGLVLLGVLWWLGRIRRPPGFLLGVFFIGYGACRFLVEFVREPDAHLGLLTLGLTMGQWLTLPMFLIGAWLVLRHRT
ncbi:MAG: prolipoprotein diacylglyceryl transferase [Magnetococcales bacterium]|nr:prolipoprotein diacylglyceryl transferase [Magnetococcales bacterium]